MDFLTLANLYQDLSILKIEVEVCSFRGKGAIVGTGYQEDKV